MGCLNGLAPLLLAPLALAILIRAPDVLFFDMRIMELGIDPVYPAILIVAAILSTLKNALTSPATAFAINAVLFAVIKQKADTAVVAPPLSCNPMWTQGGCNVLVTGANSGIGLALVTELSQQGHTVFMACRSQAKCDEAAKSVPEPPMSSGAPRVIPMGGFDLESLATVQSWTTRLGKEHSIAPFDMVIMNAGYTPKGNATTSDGFEAGLGSMHFGHFGLFKWMLSDGLMKPNALVTMVSSDAARFGSFDRSLINHPEGNGDLHGEVTYGCDPLGVLCIHAAGDQIADSMLKTNTNFGSYARAKLANVLMAREMASRYPEIRSVSVHPGMVMTPLAQKQATDMYGDTSSEWSSIVNMIQSASNMYMETILRPASKAAAIVLRATKHAETGETHGGFCNGMGEPMHNNVPATFIDDAVAKRLWDITDAIVEDATKAPADPGF